MADDAGGNHTHNEPGDSEPFDFDRLGRRRDARFISRFVELVPESSLDHHEPRWQDAIVFVVDGELMVECLDEERHCFRAGNVLTLARLPLRRVHNPGAASTQLLVIGRRPPRRFPR